MSLSIINAASAVSLVVLSSGYGLAETLSRLPLAAVHTRIIEARNQDGQVRPLQARQVWLNAKEPDGTRDVAGLVLLFDGTSHTYWWNLLKLGPEAAPGTQSDTSYIDGIASNDRHAVFSLGDRLIVFDGHRSFLEVSESTAAAADIDQAEEAALRAAQAWCSKPLASRQQLTRTLYLLSGLDPSFTWKWLDSRVTPIRLESVRRDGSRWLIDALGHWEIRITLDDAYKLVRWERISDRSVYSPADRQ